MSHVFLPLFILFAAPADPPAVDALDFDSMPIAAPRMEDVETALTALEGKAPSREVVERAWWTLAQQTRVDFADVVRLAGNRVARKKLDEVAQEHLGQPTSIVDMIDWAAEMRPMSDASVFGCRLRRIVNSRARKLEGVVVDADGKPVDGAVVRSWGKGWFAKSDAAGKFSFDNFSPKDFFRLAAAEKEDLYGRVYPIQQNSDAKPLEIRLEKMKRLAATVKDADGKPVRNAAVTVSGLGANPAKIENGFWWQSVAHTDADGKAEVGQLLDGDSISYVVARHRSYASSPVDRSQPGKWSAELTLQRGVEIRVRIVGPDDAPLEGASLNLRKAADNASPWRRIADGKGRVSVVASPGRYALVAEHPDWAMAKQEIDVEADKPLDDVALKLAEGQFIEGRVEHNGKPVPFTEVGWISLASGPGVAANGRAIGPSNHTCTNAEGEYRIGPLSKEFTYKLMASEAEGNYLFSSEAVEAGAKGVVIVVKPQ